MIVDKDIPRKKPIRSPCKQQTEEILVVASCEINRILIGYRNMTSTIELFDALARGSLDLEVDMCDLKIEKRCVYFDREKVSRVTRLGHDIRQKMTKRMFSKVVLKRLLSELFNKNHI
jgi:hypothetical protein